VSTIAGVRKPVYGATSSIYSVEWWMMDNALRISYAAVTCSIDVESKGLHVYDGQYTSLVQVSVLRWSIMMDSAHLSCRCQCGGGE